MDWLLLFAVETNKSMSSKRALSVTTKCSENSPEMKPWNTFTTRIERQLILEIQHTTSQANAPPCKSIRISSSEQRAQRATKKTCCIIDEDFVISWAAQWAHESLIDIANRYSVIYRICRKQFNEKLTKCPFLASSTIAVQALRSQTSLDLLLSISMASLSRKLLCIPLLEVL